MSVTGDDFLASANAMLEAGDEMSRRNASSRAYYAAFHAAGRYANMCPTPEAVSGGMHKRFTAAFCQHETNPRARAIGYVLEQMRKLRVKADYGLGDAVTEVEARTQVAQAKEIPDRLEAAFS